MCRTITYSIPDHLESCKRPPHLRPPSPFPSHPQHRTRATSFQNSQPTFSGQIQTQIPVSLQVPALVRVVPFSKPFSISVHHSVVPSASPCRLGGLACPSCRRARDSCAERARSCVPPRAVRAGMSCTWVGGSGGRMGDTWSQSLGKRRWVYQDWGS